MLRLKLISYVLMASALMACGQSDATNSQMTNSQATEKETAATVSEQKATAWTMVAEESSLKFSAQQQGETFTGQFTEFDADIHFDPDNLVGSSVLVRVPLVKVDAGDNDRNATLPSKAWFSVKKFPEAIFTSTDFSKTSEGEYTAQGVLTLKGVEKPLSLPFSLTIEGNRAVMDSQVTLDRTDWNIGEDPWHTDEWVSTEVSLDILVTAEK